MSYIPIPKDLSKIKSKVAFGLTARQLVCFAIAGAVGLPVFFTVRSCTNASLAALCMIVVMLPVLLFAIYEHHGQPMEVLVKHFLEAQFLRPKVRPYKTDNAYAALERQAKLKKEVRTIVFSEEKAQK
jgi:hypothetical protein